MIPIVLESNAAQVLAQLDRFPTEMLRGVARAMDLENEFTIASIQREKLSRRGPTTLGVVTNRLRSSIARAPAAIVGDNLGVVSAIGSNVRYAGAHEFGFDGAVTVRAHERRLYDRQQIAPAQKYLDPKTGRIRTRRAKEIKVERTSVTVRTHSRHMRTPARAYIRTTIEARAPAYASAVSAAIVTAWRNPTA